MESAIDSAVSKVALETFEAEAREAIAAFVCGTTFSYRYRDWVRKIVLLRPNNAYYRWFSTSCCKGVVRLCFYSAACRRFRPIVVTIRFIAHLFNRNRVKHAT